MHRLPSIADLMAKKRECGLFFRALLLLAMIALVATAVIVLSSEGRFVSPSMELASIGEANRATINPDSTIRKNQPRSHGGAMEDELARARTAIRRAAATGKVSGFSSLGDALPHPNIYRNAAAFYQSYREMEKRLRVYVYEEGEPPLVHDGPCKDIYTSEGRFIAEMEMVRSESFRTRDPRLANVFFLPFSVTKMVQYLYVKGSFIHAPMRRFVADYVSVVASKYPYWNRTAGADHFMLSCHDWGPSASKGSSELYENSIRALCNANTSEGFRPAKDVSIPEIHLKTGEIPAQLQSSPPESTPRPYLAFFSGGPHGPIRDVIFRHWIGRDEEIQVFNGSGGIDYFSFMLRSRFCLCPSGYEVASPRIVEAIYAECVPVIISEAYVLPFSDVLQWEEFSVMVGVGDVPRLKEVLDRVTEGELRRMRKGVRAVRRHFVLNHPPARFDAFHMILHSVWLRRLNLRLG